MKKTVEDVLQIESFQKTHLIAGKNGIRREVKGATLMEVPDIIPYVEEGRLLITTLYPIAGNREQMEQLIVQLNEKRLAGICIKPLRYIESIPDFMIAQADELNFPIIELPQDANLSILVNRILEMFLDEHIAQMEFRNVLHQNLMELMLQGANVEQLTEKLAQLMKREIRILDNLQRTICHCYEDGVVEAAVHDNIRVIPEDEMLVPIIAKDKQFGYIDIIKRMDLLPPDDNIRIVAEEAAMLLASVFYREYSVILEQRNFRDAFVMDLLQGKREAVREIENRMQAYGVRFVFPMYLIVVRLFTGDDKERREFYNRIIEDAGFEVQSDRRALHGQSGYLLCYQDVLVWFKYGKTMDEIEQSCMEILHKIVGWIGGGKKAGIGISEQIDSPSFLKDVYNQTCNLVNAGAPIHKQSFLILYRDNRILELVSRIPDTEVLSQFVERVLGPVIQYDQDNHGELMETLKILIDNHFQMKEASAASFLHYNTIRYRVSRLKELGIDFEPGRGMAELVLAYEGYVWLRAINENHFQT